MRLENKVAVVTGAGGEGSGRAIALRFGRRGAAVVVSDIQEEGARETVRQIEASGGRASMLKANVRREADIRALIAHAEQMYGGLDVLVNNASAPHSGEPLEEWMATIETDLLGTLYGTYAAIDAMRRRGGGAIINIGSTSALAHGRTTPGGWVPYDVAKAGVMRLTTRLADVRDSDGIRVNCLVPHWIAVPEIKTYVDSLTPEQRQTRGVPPRLITLDEIADAVEYLATDESLAGRLLVFWDTGPRLVRWGDAGFFGEDRVTITSVDARQDAMDIDAARQRSERVPPIPHQA
jgi:NAD(P)-dependent dehydrogenase (short-subunit alcohol dehydrogenase family)